MSDEFEIELEADEQPKNGEWVETCDVIQNPTEEELAEGQRLGELDEEDGFADGGISSGSATDERDRAMKKARLMKEVLLDYGVPQVKIGLMPGRPSPYGYWDSGFFVADMSHHTVSRFGSNLTPVLGLCRNGRSDLPGPLCNGYGGYDLTYRIITFGYANHPGYGGPYLVPALTAGSFTIPKDSARRYAWGTEWEGGLAAADWDRELRNPRNGKRMTMREFMGRTNKALEEALEIASGAHMEHSTWTSRKIDRLGYDKQRGIEEKNRYGKQEFQKRYPNGPVVDLENIQDEFRKANGLEGGKMIRRRGVRTIQSHLNIKPTGLVDTETLKAWAEFEEKVGIVGRERIPDEDTMKKFSRRHKINVK